MVVKAYQNTQETNSFEWLEKTDRIKKYQKTPKKIKAHQKGQAPAERNTRRLNNMSLLWSFIINLAF